MELGLARWVVEHERSRCWGSAVVMQVLNVALGGTLYADVSEHPSAQRHTYYPGMLFDLRPHAVQIAEDLEDWRVPSAVRC